MSIEQNLEMEDEAVSKLTKRDFYEAIVRLERMDKKLDERCSAIFSKLHKVMKHLWPEKYDVDPVAGTRSEMMLEDEEDIKKRTADKIAEAMQMELRRLREERDEWKNLYLGLHEAVASIELDICTP